MHHMVESSTNSQSMDVRTSQISNQPSRGIQSMAAVTHTSQSGIGDTGHDYRPEAANANDPENRRLLSNLGS